MADAASGDCRALNQLPTLQRNALRKLFNRPAFTPEEVAGLGYRRIQQAEGIGLKGMATIKSWLKEHGFDLQPDPVPGQARERCGKRVQRSLAAAMRVLRNHGYVVRGPEDQAPDGA